MKVWRVAGGVLVVLASVRAYGQLGLPSALATAAPATETVAGTPERAAPQPIPLADIFVRAQAAERLVRSLASLSHPSVRGLAGLQEELSERLAEVDQLRSDPEYEIGPDLSLGALDSIRSLWAAQAAKLQIWEENLARRAGQFEEQIVDLRRRIDTWEATRDHPEEPLPDAAAERVRRTLDTLTQAEALARERRDTILLIQDRVGQQALEVTDLRDRAEDRARDLRPHLLETDAPPLWAAPAVRDGAVASLPDRLGAALHVHGNALGRFAEANGAWIALHAVIFALLALVVLRVRRDSRSWPQDDPALLALARGLGRPVAAAAIPALIISPWLYPRAPDIVNRTVGLLALLATVAFLAPLVQRQLKGALGVLSTLYVVVQWSELIAAPPLGGRWLFLGMQAVGCLGLLWTLRASRRQPAENDGAAWWRSKMRAAAWVSMVILLAAGVANLIGKFALSRMLTRATVRATFIAVVFAACSLVLEGLWAAALRSATARKLHAVCRHEELLRRRGQRFVRAAMPILWAGATLHFFHLLVPLVDSARQGLAATLKIRDFEVSLGAILAFFAVQGAAVWLSRFVRFILEEDVLSRADLPRGIPVTISTTLHYLLVSLGFFAALSAAGVELSKFTILGGAFGIGLAFGMQNIVNNFVSGLILLYERPVQVGDTVEIGVTLGVVRRIGIRSSTVETFDGAEIIVPNADLIAKEVTNWTLTDRQRRLEFKVGVAYGNDPARVVELLRAAAATHPDVLPEPAPVALFLGFGDSSLDFALRVWTARFESHPVVRSEVGMAVHRALADAGIEIPFPQRDVHVRSMPAGARS